MSQDIDITINTAVQNQEDVKALQKELQRTENVSDTLSDSIDKLANSFGELAEASKLKDALDETNIAAAEAKQKYDDATDALDAFKTTFEATKDTMSVDEIANANKEIARQEKELKALERAQKNATKAQERAQNAIDNASSSVRDLVNNTDDFNNQLTRTAAEQARVTRELSNLKSFNDAYDTAGVKNLQEEIDNLEKAYKTLEESGRLTEHELKQAHENITREIDEHRRALDGTNEAMQDLKKSAIQFAPFAAGFAVVAKSAIEFEYSMAGVRKVVTATDEEFAELTDSILEMSKTTPVAAAGLAEIAAAGAQLGVTVDNLQHFTKVAADMATAFDISADEAGQAIAKMSNIFGLTINETEKLGDAINNIANNSAAAAPQVIDVLTRIGAQGKAIGLASEEVAALGSTLIAFGKSPEIAGTAVNTFLTKLQTLNSASDKAKESMQKMGVSTADMAIRLREDASSAIIYFLEQLNTLNTTDKAEALTAIFGTGQQADVLQMASNLGVLKQQFDLVGNSADYAGSMQKEAAVMAETTAKQIELMKNNLNALSITIGTKLLPVINDGIDTANTFVTALSNFGEANPELAKIIIYLGLAVPAMRALNASLVLIGNKGGAALAAVGFRMKGLTAETARANAMLGVFTGLAKKAFLPLLAVSYIVDWFQALTDNLSAQNALYAAQKIEIKALAEHEKKLMQANKDLKESTASLTLEQIKNQEATQSQIDDINRLNENLGKLGLTYDAIQRGITAEADSVIKNFRSIGESAFANGKVIAQSFAKSLDSIKSPEEFNLIVAEFNAMAEAGKITGVSIDDAKNKLDEMYASLAMGQLTQEEFNARKSELINLLLEETNGFKNVNLEISKQIQLINTQIALDKKLLDSTIRKLEAEKEKAKVLGETAKIEEIERQIQIVRIGGMKEEVKLLAKRTEEYKKELLALEARKANGEALTEAEEQRILSLKNEIVAQQNEIEAINASAQAKELDISMSHKNASALDGLAKSANNAAQAQSNVASSIVRAGSASKEVERESKFSSWLGGIADESKKSEEALGALTTALKEAESAAALDRMSLSPVHANGKIGQLETLKNDIVHQIKKSEEIEQEIANASGKGLDYIEALQSSVSGLNYVSKEITDSMSENLERLANEAKNVYADIDRENADLVNRLTMARNQDETHQLRMKQMNERASLESKIQQAQEDGDSMREKKLRRQMQILQQMQGQEQRIARDERQAQERDKSRKIDVNLNGKNLKNLDPDNASDMRKIAEAVVDEIVKDQKKSTKFVIKDQRRRP